jgi:hypothetical protein
MSSSRLRGRKEACQRTSWTLRQGEKQHLGWIRWEWQVEMLQRLLWWRGRIPALVPFRLASRLRRQKRLRQKRRRLRLRL